jgi:predicted phage-related endonuclease
MTIQRTDEWRLERAGYATASCFAAVRSKGKNGEAVGRRNYRVQLVTERLTLQPAESGFENAATKWGNEQEPAARVAYELLRGALVEQVGFVKHPTIEWTGCSPDGLVGADGGVQIKCPYVSANHIDTILEKRVPTEYVAQVQGELWVTGREWWDYVSFDPRMPEHLQLCIIRAPRDEAYIKELEAEVVKFLAEVDELYERLARRAA